MSEQQYHITIKKSQCKVDRTDPNLLSWIDQFELDKEILAKIPLEKRLIFELFEFCTIHLYHESIVNAIMSVKPQGVSFTKVEKWWF